VLIVGRNIWSSVEHELHGNRHPHCHRLPTPAGRLKAPAPDGLDCSLVEVWMPRRLLDLGLFHAPLFGNIRFDDDGAFDTLSPG
jgi:hypothetical protein